MTDLLPDFLAFAAPDIHAAIDWTTAPVFLDKEFQAIARQAAIGPRTADLIVQLRLRSGAVTWLVLHIEIQGQQQDEFAARMFTYYALVHLRLWRQRRRRAPRQEWVQPALILGLAVLTDDHESWQPGPYEARGFGLGVRYDYRVVKLLDSQIRAAAEAAPENPFALIARTWLDFQAAGQREADAITALRVALHTLSQGRYSEEQLATILVFIEQIARLPMGLYRALLEEARVVEGAAMAQVMSYVERKGWREGLKRGREEGREEGRLDVVLRFLTGTLGALDDATADRVRALDADVLLALTDALLAFESQADLDRWLTDHGA